MTPINIIKHDVLGLAVSGRELYKLIGNSQADRDVFSDWFNARIKRFDFAGGKDYIRTEVDSPNIVPGKRRSKSFEYIVALEAAEQVATFQLAKRGMGVLAYIKEYKRTNEQVALPLLSTQPTTDAAASHSATSAISVLPESNQPKINFDAALPELEKLGPPNQPSPLPVAQPVTQSSANQQRLLATLSEPTLSPVQQLLQQAQQLANDEAKREQVPNELFTSFDNRLKVIEKKLNSVVFFFQQSANVLANIVPVESGVDPAPVVESTTKEQTTRAKLVRLVDAYVTITKTKHQTLWNWLYAKLTVEYDFDAYAYGKGQKDPNYLDIAEEHGQIENLYTIADQALRPKS